MAEVVQRNNEEILPQFEEIIHLNLFSSAEMKEVIRKHVEYEYKLVRREKNVKDFHVYITYKKDFLKLARIRMKSASVNKKDRRRIERMLVTHTSKLYDSMVKYFSADVSLWQEYIEFMIKEKEYAKVVMIYDSLLSFHMGEAQLFINSAKFLMKYVRDVDLARKTLFKGIRMHKNDPLLYQEIFKIELDFAARKRRESAEEEEKLRNDPVLSGKTAEVVFTSALKVITDMNFKFTLLEICLKYKFAKSLQKKIYKSIKSNHNFEPEMWKRVALLQIEGVNLEMIDSSCTKSKDIFKQRVWRCFNVFLKAVKAIPTEMMWFHFIDTFFELLKSYPEKCEFLNKFLINLIQRNTVQSLLHEEHYLCWIENTEKHISLENLMSLIENAIQAFPQSAKLWLKKLQYHLGQHDPEKFKEIFNEAHKCLKDEHSQYKLWQFMLQSCVDLSVSEINAFFENLIKESPVTYPTLRPLYLDWVISKNNLSLARSVFANVSQIPPYNIELFRKMIGMELSQQTVDVTIIRQLYELACLYFGSTHSELWLDYVQFEKLYGNPMHVTNIYWTAVKQLEPSLSDKFITEFSLLKTA